MAKQQLVLALFPDEAAADQAVDRIKQWSKDNDQVPLGGIGVLVKDEKGKLKTHKLGARRTIGGMVLFGLAALLTGGMAVGLGVIGGTAVGAGIGHLFHKGLSISKEELDQLNKELDGGKAAVGVMAYIDDAPGVVAVLEDQGGQTLSFEVPEETVAEAQAAAEAEPEDTKQ